MATPSKERIDQLMGELFSIEMQLSPENLTCDGELPASQVRRRYAQLSKQKAAVCKELGYEPTEEQVYDWADKRRKA